MEDFEVDNVLDAIERRGKDQKKKDEDARKERVLVYTLLVILTCVAFGIGYYFSGAEYEGLLKEMSTRLYKCESQIKQDVLNITPISMPKPAPLPG